MLSKEWNEPHRGTLLEDTRGGSPKQILQGGGKVCENFRKVL